MKKVKLWPSYMTAKCRKCDSPILRFKEERGQVYGICRKCGWEGKI